jgi:hypothetical protein
MDEILRIFEMGYFDAISDLNNRLVNKNFINVVDKCLLSKIYDLGYVFGYNKYKEYIENNI